MKKIFLYGSLICFLVSCNNADKKSLTAETNPAAATEKATVDLPYTASYSSSFDNDVSDADLKMVLMSYKDWADSNVQKVVDVMADTLNYDSPNGETSKLTRAELLKRWGTFRDSLSSVKIEMQAWHKMHSMDKKDKFIVTWYKEYDTYKNGKVDSNYWHDINQVKDGKINWYSQYKRPMKKM